MQVYNTWPSFQNDDTDDEYDFEDLSSAEEDEDTALERERTEVRDKQNTEQVSLMEGADEKEERQREVAEETAKLINIQRITAGICGLSAAKANVSHYLIIWFWGCMYWFKVVQFETKKLYLMS